MYLSENEKQKISKEIEDLEKQSSAELVAVITKQSSSYKYENILVSLIFVILFSIISLLVNDISATRLFQWQVIILFFSYFIFVKFDYLLLKVLPKAYRYNKSSKYANKQFINLGLQTTKTKQAIMFFVSIDEKFVEIITDSKIKEKIEDSYWQTIVDSFILDVKNKQLQEGYLKAIKSCNKILIENFPIQEDDENELSNEVIELNK